MKDNTLDANDDWKCSITSNEEWYVTEQNMITDNLFSFINRFSTAVNASYI